MAGSGSASAHGTWSLRVAGRVLRARRLYRWGQGVAALGGSTAAARAARLYRRGLRVLGAPVAPAPAATSGADAARLLAREQLRAELARHGLRALAARHPRAAALLVGLCALLGAGFLASSWLAPDLAEGKGWSASSAWGPFPLAGAMIGDAPLDGRFHTNDEPYPWVVVDLGKVHDVHAVKVDNRVNCCRERAVPLRIELSLDNVTFVRVAYRRALFESFTARFATRKARYVRLIVDRRSTLHLRRVAVY